MIDAGGGGMAMGGAIAVSGPAVTAVSGGTAAIAGLPTAVVGEPLWEQVLQQQVPGYTNGERKQEPNEGYNRGKSKATKSLLSKGKKDMK